MKYPKSINTWSHWPPWDLWHVIEYANFICSALKYLFSLIFLGIGWNFLFIGGTSLLVLCYKESEKFKVQGFNDVLVFSIQSIASLIAGYSILKFSWNEINLACIPLVLLIILVSIRADIYKKKLIFSKS